MQPSDISTGLVARVVVITAAVVGTIYFLYLILSVIGLVLIAVFFALALAPAVNWLDNRRVPRWAARIRRAPSTSSTPSGGAGTAVKRLGSLG